MKTLTLQLLVDDEDFNWRWLWEKTRLFVLAAAWCAFGVVCFRERLEYETERRVNHAQVVQNAATTAHMQCSENLQRVLYGIGIRRGDVKPEWLEAWKEEP